MAKGQSFTVKVCSLHCAVFNVQYFVFSLQCVVCSLHCYGVVYIVQCSVISVQCSVGSKKGEVCFALKLVFVCVSSEQFKVCSG